MTPTGGVGPAPAADSGPEAGPGRDAGPDADLGPAPGPRGRRGYWVPGLIAMTVLLAIGLAFGAGDLDHRSSSTLNGADVAEQIAVAIEAQQSAHGPPEVECPPSEPVRPGWRFVCTVEQTASERTVQVTEIDGRGHLHWQLNS